MTIVRAYVMKNLDRFDKKIADEAKFSMVFQETS